MNRLTGDGGGARYWRGRGRGQERGARGGRAQGKGAESGSEVGGEGGGGAGRTAVGTSRCHRFHPPNRKSRKQLLRTFDEDGIKVSHTVPLQGEINPHAQTDGEVCHCAH